MKKIIFRLVVSVVFQTLTFGQQEPKTTDPKNVLAFRDDSGSSSNTLKAVRIPNLEIPRTNSNDMIIVHSGYSLLYNETNEQASWVAYDLTKAETNKVFKRSDKFKPDPKVTTGSACNEDYKYSGFDRGHLAPAADMGWSETSMAESFYYSNMSPQTPSFNRGIWKKLEELIRSWAIENENIYIVTGPVLTAGLPTVDPNKVSVPNFYYKVILDYTEPGIKGIGFILPNSASKEQLQGYALPIDDVERATGIDFFPLLEDRQEELIEKTLCIECWTWKNFKKKRRQRTEGRSNKSQLSRIK